MHDRLGILPTISIPYTQHGINVPFPDRACASGPKQLTMGLPLHGSCAGKSPICSGLSSWLHQPDLPMIRRCICKDRPSSEKLGSFRAR